MALNAAANFIDKRLDERHTVVNPQPDAQAPGETMLALVWQGNENVKVERVPIPTITEPDDVVCRVTGTTVCGSDLHLYHKEILELRGGDILGHEWMGVVQQTGPAVRNIKTGDRVVASFQIACGECEYCKALNTSMCKNTNPSRFQEKFYGQAFAGIYGYSHFTGGYPGGQAEYVRAPKADYNLLKIPDSVPDEKALYLSDIVPTSYHAVQCAEVTKGKSVAIWGLGPIGLCAARWAQLAGAKRVICIDAVDYRLEKAKSLGCDVIDFKQDKDVVAAVQKLEPEGVDCSIDAAGFRYAKSVLHKVERATGLETDSPENINEALQATKKFGTIALVADYVGLANHVLVGALMEKGITLRGTGQAPVQKYWHQLLKKIESGEFDPTFILTHRFPITEFAELYKAFDKKEENMLKVFVETRFSKPAAPGTPALSTLS